jgi:hypothetical protein
MQVCSGSHQRDKKSSFPGIGGDAAGNRTHHSQFEAFVEGLGRYNEAIMIPLKFLAAGRIKGQVEYVPPFRDHISPPTWGMASHPSIRCLPFGVASSKVAKLFLAGFRRNSSPSIITEIREPALSLFCSAYDWGIVRMREPPERRNDEVNIGPPYFTGI